MTKKTDKDIDDLKARGYQEGDLSTLPTDVDNDLRKKVEQHEADLANERMKNTEGQDPVLYEQPVILNPNQYGFAERITADPTAEAKTRAAQAKAKTPPSGGDAKSSEPFGGKGDHDGVNGPGGAKKPVDTQPSGEVKK
jgi:hypothetical protein